MLDRPTLYHTNQSFGACQVGAPSPPSRKTDAAVLSRIHRGPLVVVLSGPSGVGKDAMLNRMRIVGAPYHFTVTATTRPIRPSEKHDVDYIFMTKDEFAAMKDEGEFLESAEVYGNWYGVPKPQVRQALQNGSDVIIKPDVQGAATIKRIAPRPSSYLSRRPPCTSWSAASAGASPSLKRACALGLGQFGMRWSECPRLIT